MKRKTSKIAQKLILCEVVARGHGQFPFFPLASQPCTLLADSMSDKRRAEIEAKRQKLAELRKARADRQKADNERRASDVRVV
jgi:hypothetical protein